jgi:hypothetical protein
MIVSNKKKYMKAFFSFCTRYKTLLGLSLVLLFLGGVVATWVFPFFFSLFFGDMKEKQEISEPLFQEEVFQEETPQIEEPLIAPFLKPQFVNEILFFLSQENLPYPLFVFLEEAYVPLTAVMLLNAEDDILKDIHTKVFERELFFQNENKEFIRIEE